MPAQITTLELYTDLPQVGGTKIGDIPWAGSLVEVLSEDGDDSLVVQIPLRYAMTTSVAKYQVVQLTREDATVSHYIVQKITRAVSASGELCTLTCAGARSYLNGFTATTAATLTGSPVSILGQIVSLTHWPANFGFSGGAGTPSLSVTVNVGDSMLTIVSNFLSAYNATLSLGSAPIVIAWAPASGVLYQGTLLTTVPAGTAELIKDKNIALFSYTDDGTDPTKPAIGFDLTIADLYRTNPGKYGLDKLLPFQTARVVWPPLSIDQVIRIVKVTTNYAGTISTQVELGTPVRLLAQENAAAIDATAAAVDAIPPPNVLVYLTPLTITATAVTLRLQAVTPLGARTVTVNYTVGPGSLAVAPGSSSTLSATADVSTTGHLDFTITRDAFGTTDGQIGFTCTADGHLDGTATATIETVSNLASATKTIPYQAAGLISTNGDLTHLNSDGSIQSVTTPLNVEQRIMACPMPENVTITQLAALMLGSGTCQVALFRGDGTLVGSGLVSGSGSFATYTQALSENTGTGGSNNGYYVRVSFNGGAVVGDRQINKIFLQYTSPSLQNTY